MCGIVGKVNLDNSLPVDLALINRMQQCIAHRGPDESAAWVSGGVGLGFQRLAIIDVAGGHQPMTNEDGSIRLIFNGEIYNFEDLREQLSAAGHKFTTHSDTETLVHGWEEWATDLPRRLRGMFAFALWDARRQSLFLCRDRVGKKPLYYAHLKPGASDEALTFASELKSLLADPAFPRSRSELDYEALSHYLTYQYVPHPWTIFRGARKLPPAHWLLYERGKLTIERYWELSYEPKREITEAEAIEEALAQLDEATRIRLISEVPLGCFLSGGIDSSAVVAMMRRHITGELKTFSIGFSEDAYNELPYARRVAEKFETTHEEFVVQPDALGILGTLAWHFDEPFADSSAVPTYYLSKMTRQRVTVALNGDGGDESFAGYSRYGGLCEIQRWQKLPQWSRNLMQTVMSRAGTLSERAAYMNRVSLLPPEEAYVHSMILFRQHQKQRLLSPELRQMPCMTGEFSERLTTRHLQRADGLAHVDKMMLADIELYLPGDLLPKVDRMTMANSLEGRSPFLDNKMMEFAARLPAEVKYPGGRSKHIMKKAMLRFFPPDFIDRPKMGFAIPLATWLRNELRPFTHDLLLSKTAQQRGLFNPKYVRQLVDEHMSSKRDHHARLWTLLMFEAWAQTFLDRPDPLAGPVNFG